LHLKTLAMMIIGGPGNMILLLLIG